MSEYIATLFVISAPSGAGKTSLVKALVESTKDIQVSVSHTTRAQRLGEQDGVNYHFVSKDAFMGLLEEARFLEHALVFDHYYGTSQDWVEGMLAKGVDVILEIDWQGAEQIRKVMDCRCISILPPSLMALEERLTHRGQDSIEVINRRMSQAKEEIAHFGESDYVVINDDFEQALTELKAIVLSERCRTPIQTLRHSKLLQDLQN
jgi:guanylate kinase